MVYNTICILGLDDCHHIYNLDIRFQQEQCIHSIDSTEYNVSYNTVMGMAISTCAAKGKRAWQLLLCHVVLKSPPVPKQHCGIVYSYQCNWKHSRSQLSSDETWIWPGDTSRSSKGCLACFLCKYTHRPWWCSMQSNIPPYLHLLLGITDWIGWSLSCTWIDFSTHRHVIDSNPTCCLFVETKWSI